MKQILFMGITDKTDLMFYMCDLFALQHKVLLVDVTKNHNYKNTYPIVEMETDIRQHDLFDITENITNKSQFEKIVAEEGYDYIFIDIDQPELIKEWYQADHHVVVTTYDNREIQGNLSLLEALFNGHETEELLPFSRVICEASHTFHEDYLNSVYEKLPISWQDTFVYYPDERDTTAKINNQLRTKLDVTRLSKEYKMVLIQLAASLLNLTFKDARQWWRQLERR